MALSGSIRKRARHRERAEERVFEITSTAQPYNAINAAMFTKKITYLIKNMKIRTMKWRERRERKGRNSTV